MEMLKSKSIIALIIMILGVSYFSALSNSGVQSQKCSNNSISVQA